MTTDDGLSLAFGVILFAALVVIAAIFLSGCTSGRCTSHPYDPKACLAPAGAEFGAVDGGPSAR